MSRSVNLSSSSPPPTSNKDNFCILVLWCFCSFVFLKKQISQFVCILAATRSNNFTLLQTENIWEGAMRMRRRRSNEKEQQGLLILHFEKERIHGDWASFSPGPFLSVKKKRCQRQIIYFCRRSVIKVFAPPGFLWPPITVEIIIIGQQSLFFQWQRMQRKICLWEMFWGQTSTRIRKTFTSPPRTLCVVWHETEFFYPLM